MYIYNVWNFKVLSNSTKKTGRYGSKQCDTDHLSYGQIYHKITNLKLLYMPSSKSKKVKLLKFVNVGSASIMKDT